MIPIKANSHGWCLSDRSLHFASVVDLVMHYQKNSLKEVSTVLDITLTYPIKRAEVCTYVCTPFDFAIILILVCLVYIPYLKWC